MKGYNEVIWICYLPMDLEVSGLVYNPSYFILITNLLFIWQQGFSHKNKRLIPIQRFMLEVFNFHMLPLGEGMLKH